MKKLAETNKKKIVVGISSGVLAASLFGGAAYAYKDEFTAKIQGIVHNLAVNVIFKDEIEKKVANYGDQKENELKSYVGQIIDGIKKDLETFKQQEIQRGKFEIDREFDANKNSIRRAVNCVLEQEKQAQQRKTDAEVNKSKEDMNKAIKDALNDLFKK